MRKIVIKIALNVFLNDAFLDQNEQKCTQTNYLIITDT